MVFELAKRKLKKLFEDHHKRTCDAAMAPYNSYEWVKKNFDEYDSVFEAEEIDRIFDDIENELNDIIKEKVKEELREINTDLEQIWGHIL